MNTTKKISVSVTNHVLAVLKKRAKRLYGGNLSAVIAEMAVSVAQQDAREALIERLGIPSLTDKERETIVREQAGKDTKKKRVT